MAYLVDTNFISELCRREPDRGVLTWTAGVTRYAVSVISVDEIAFGIPRQDRSAQRAGFRVTAPWSREASHQSSPGTSAPY